MLRALLAMLVGLAAWTLADRPLQGVTGVPPEGARTTLHVGVPANEPDDAERWWQACRHVSTPTIDARWHGPLPLVATDRFTAGPAREHSPALTTDRAAPSVTRPHLQDIPLLI